MSLGETAAPAEMLAPPAAEPIPAGLRDRLGLYVIVGSNGFNILALTALVTDMYQVSLHFTEGDGGLLASLFGWRPNGALVAQMLITLLGIGIMLGGPAAGFLAERIGHRRLLPLGLGLYAVAGAAGLYVDDALLLWTGRFVQGLASAGILISVFSLIGERFEGQARARILGMQSVFVSGVGLVSLLAGGWIADLGGWRAPFAVYLLALPVMLLAVAVLPGRAAPRATQKAAESRPPGFALLKRLWPLYAMLVPFYFAAYMTTVHLPFVLAGDGVTSGKLQGTIMMASMAFNIIGAASYSTLLARFGRRWMFVMLLGIFAASDLVIGLWASAVGSTAGCWVAGLAGGLMGPFFTNTILTLTPFEARGRAIGLMYMAMYVGDFLNPFVVTPMRNAIGNHTTFAIVGAALAVAALVQAATRRSPVGAEAR